MSTCLVCGKEFKSYKSTEGRKKYCSVECRKTTTHVARRCLFCKNGFLVAQSRFYQKGNRYKCCSLFCYAQYTELLRLQRIERNTYICANCGVKFVGVRAGKTGIKFCSQLCSKEYMRGERAFSYTDGTTINVAGYKMIKVGDKYLYEHRLIMEDYLQRKLNQGEVVHHIDGDRLNNNIENLELMDKPDHDRLHTIRRHTNEKRFGGQKSSRALRDVQ